MMSHRSAGAIAARRPRRARALSWLALALLMGLGMVLEGPALAWDPAPATAQPSVATASHLDDIIDDITDFIDDLLGDNDEETPPTDEPPVENPPADEDPVW